MAPIALATAFAITAGSAGPCAQIISASEGVKRLVLASAPGPSLDDLFRQHASSIRLQRALAGARMATAELRRRCRRQEIQASRPEIRVTMVDGAALRNNEVSTVIYQDFLPAALAVGAYQAAPEPRVIGHGLRHVPVALETQRSGVSATKIVVSLG